MEKENMMICSVGGCDAYVNFFKEAYLPPLKVMAKKLGRRVEVSDLEAFVVCPACARAFVAHTQAQGISGQQIFHPYAATKRQIEKGEEYRREVAKARAKKQAEQAEAKRRQTVTSLGVLFGSVFAEAKNQISPPPQPMADVVDHPTKKAKKSGKKNRQVAG